MIHQLLPEVLPVKECGRTMNLLGTCRKAPAQLSRRSLLLLVEGKIEFCSFVVEDIYSYLKACA